MMFEFYSIATSNYKIQTHLFSMTEEDTFQGVA